MAIAALEHMIFGVGIACYVTYLLLIATPLLTIRKIWTRGVEGFSPYLYLATLFNCMLWCFYTPSFDPSSTVVLIISAIGLVLEFAYVFVFLYFGNNVLRIKICICLVTECLAFIVVVALTIGLFDTHADRMTFVGICRIISGIAMYISPLFIVLNAINTRSVEFLPYSDLLWYDMRAFLWTVYALLTSDRFMLIENAVGAFLGIVHGFLSRTVPAPTAEEMERPVAAAEIFEAPDAALNPLRNVALNSASSASVSSSSLS